MFVCLFVCLSPVGQGLLIHEVSRSHTTTHHSRYDSSGRVISPSQRPLPDNTQNSQETDIHAPVGFEPIIPAGERPQTYALDRAATGTGGIQYNTIQYSQTTLIIFYEFFVRSLDGLNRNIKNHSRQQALLSNAQSRC